MNSISFESLSLPVEIAFSPSGILKNMGFDSDVASFQKEHISETFTTVLSGDRTEDHLVLFRNMAT